MIDIFLIVVIQSVKADPKLFIGIFKSELNMHNQRENILPGILENVFNFQKVLFLFFKVFLSKLFLV